MSDELIELPEGYGYPEHWITALLSEVCHLVTDGTHHSPPNSAEGTYAYITAKNIKPHGLDTTELTYVTEEVHKSIYSRCPVEYEDVLYIKDGVTTGLAAVNHLTEAFSMLSSVALLKPIRDLVDPYYLKYWLNSPITFKSMTGSMTGSAIRRLILQKIRSVDIPVPPLNEQKRIVAKIEELNDRTQRAKEALEAIPELCDRFRQSVLAAAFRGDLTADWREQNPDVEPASVLLERIRDKRLIEAKTDKHKENIEAIYAYEEEFGTEPLADDWQYITLEKLCHTFQYGTSAKSSAEGKVPVLRMGNLQNGEIDWNDLVYTSDDDEIAKYSLKPGDILFNRTNSPELVGKTSIYRGERFAIFAGYLIKIDNYVELDSEYLNYCLNTKYAKDYCWRVKTDGVSQSNINAQKIAKFEIPFCSLQEQKEVVQQIRSLFKAIVQIEQQYQEAKKQLERFNQSILAKAFRGELVPQDPDDEPASVLLERIRAEREQLNNGKKKSQTSEKRRSKTVEGQGVLPGFE
ncbi:hypothetical protein FNW02_28730 [Komarekiella sp. 'clone 1']|uniref:Type I restriction modification DNA specificity domain-containing protein n=1 Tax=Komarekiella delphini-convector SJRDD-AB1 TaxID=2593771 RepID=A0AA40VU05_9NOST|nr:restriction endonuclease subunit S [Komarekiella delphini-convector]MBD6619695.1 hypothetical protein [Komarekiella delphini-convector SJRDD-AB1]